MELRYFYLSAAMNPRECFPQLFILFQRDEEGTGVLKAAKIQLPASMSRFNSFFN